MSADPVLLVVAKAPVPGQAKTRLATNIGYDAAADLAAAALLDTLAVAGSLGWQVVVAMTGDLSLAARAGEIRTACRPHRLVGQRGAGLAARLAAAHTDAARAAGDPGAAVVQVGMDTPQVSVEDLRAAASALRVHDAALGPAEDGGWWVLAVRAAEQAAYLLDVPMSQPDTEALTRVALSRDGASVATLGTLRDVDTWPDACAVADLAPWTRFAAGVDAVRVGAAHEALR